MTLETAYYLTGALLAVLGLAIASGVKPAHGALRAFPRSLPAAIIFFGGGAAWFLWIVLNLGESDLAGFPRGLLLGVFGVTALLAFKFLNDLLPVRGLAILLLLASRVLLDIGFMKTPHSIVLAGTAYVFVIFGIWWGASPYVFRNWSEWILEKKSRFAVAGAGILLVGFANLVAGFLVPASVA